ncbi:MAG: helix-turn-helix transcriptional regulator [Acidobacteriaceae bacterium]|nr:helix-turn-helix transcriptional regulator [Acidobacteriaceae bacterium]
MESYTGPASIKTVLYGRVSWIVGGRQLVVDPSSFLVLAAGERYSLNIDEVKPVETCCAFFAPGFLEQIAADLTSSAEMALDAPDRIAPSLPYLSAVHGDRESGLTGRVWSLAKRCEKTLNPSGTEEDFLVLAVSLLEYYEQIREQLARVPAMRPSTREELFRRLLIGREHIHSHSSDPLSLTGIARAACLSPFHFHRGFTQAFRETPHSYLTGLRLAQAQHMIERGSSVLEACLAVGFSSPSAFSRLFRKRLGYAPSAVCRRFARMDKKFATIYPHS